MTTPKHERPILPRRKPEPAQPTGLGADLLEATNAARALRGRPPLAAEAALQDAAAAHAASMAAAGVLSHVGFPARVADAGYSYSATAENVCAGPVNAQQAVEIWMGSPGHQANLLGDYRDFGGGGARARDGTWYWCAIFANPA